jgi:putative transposase
MSYNPEKHHRVSIRLKNFDYSSEGAYFVTICVKNRECIFGEILNGEINLSEIGQIAYKNWNEIPTHFKNVEIDEFVIMPNHLHGIIIINEKNNIGMDEPKCKGAINCTPIINDS